MNRVFLFNPENDIALGAGKTCFTPPKAAVAMARAGATLPWWFGDEGDYLLLPDDNLRRQWFEEVTARFGKGPSPVTSLKDVDIRELSPWGHSAYTARLFQKHGAPSSLVNTEMERSEFYRSLSHRRTALNVLRSLGSDTSAEAFSLEDVRQFAARFPDFYVKAPWSSSGRGVFRSKDISESQVEGIMRRQGSVMLEKAYDGTQDFAMLFMAHGEKIEFHGYSVFFTGGTAYGGNILASDVEIECRLSELAGAARVAQVREEIATALTETVAAPGYEGPLGVDMLVYKSDNGLEIAPCIEVNLRYTMGFVAHSVASRGISGRMVVSRYEEDYPENTLLLSAPVAPFLFAAK